MNHFYTAKKQLKFAGNLDIFGALIWSFLVFIISCYHFLYLLPADASGKQYSTLITGTEKISSNPSSNYTSSFVSERGYAELFNGITLIDFAIFKFTLWSLVLILFVLLVLVFIGKVVLGTISLYCFFKTKSIQHIFASLAVIFFPVLGGIIAINTYKATTSKLAPKYIASNSAARQKMRRMWNSFAKSNTLEPTSNI